VDGAIHRAAGPRLLDACRREPEVRPGVRCPTGEARITPGFDLAATHVIHTVGPIWYGGGANEEVLLASCYRASLDLASSHGLRSIAFPAISCGVYRFPKERASAIAVDAILRHLEGETTVSDVYLVAFDELMFSILETAIDRGAKGPGGRGAKP
jgi:O-acetyl-ADP-ribose deacetylase (regulator of RNase III)